MIISSEFGVDIVAFYRVKVRAFLLVVKDLHCVVYGVEGVCLFNQVLGKFRSVAVVSKPPFVLLIPRKGHSTGLTHIRFIAVGACKFVNPRLCVFICYVMYR